MPNKKSVFVELSILQNVPVGNINRDDTNSVKTGTYGGTQRLRVSSQCKKHAMRQWWNEHMDVEKLGYRTKYLTTLIAEKIVEKSDVAYDDAVVVATGIVSALGIPMEDKPTRKRKNAEGELEDMELATKSLVMASVRQIDAFAELGISELEAGTIAVKDGKLEGADKKFDTRCKLLFDLKRHPELQGIDVALFGRMVAEHKDMCVDACCCVSHMLSVDPCEIQYDYYSAVDDYENISDNGAAMLDTTQFATGDMHGYTSLNVSQLLEELGDKDATIAATDMFIRAYLLSMPTGKQHSFATLALPNMSIAHVGSSTTYSTVSAFERAVRAKPGESIRELAANKLVNYVKRVDSAYNRDGYDFLFSACEDCDNTSGYGKTYTTIDDYVDAIVTQVVALI